MPLQWVGLTFATALSAVLEAMTLQIDNLFLPMIYYAQLMLFAL